MSTEPESGLRWLDSYRRNLSSYENCTKKLKVLIEDLLKEAGIEVVAVEGRTKDPDSLVQKVERKRDEYTEPLSEVTDLIGARVIAYYLEDVDRIAEVIQNEFAVDLDQSTDKLEELEPDRFGYRSVHYIVSLSKKRAGLTEWGVFEHKRAEIQLRTATQHAWAAVEHKLSYKRTREAPRELRRRLTRLSALFELADEQFSAVRGQLEEVETQYGNDVRGGNLEIPIDKASLDAFLVDNALVAAVIERAVSKGFILRAPASDGYALRLDIDLRDLVEVLDRVGIKTIAELHQLLGEDSIAEAIDRLGPASTAGKIKWGTSADVLCALILFQVPDAEDLITSIYDPSIIRFFEGARG